MKVWFKYLLGIALGLIAAFIIPFNNAKGMEILSFITNLFVHFGRYILIPLIFFTAIISVNKLRTSRLFLKTSIWTVAIIIISTLIVTLIGTLSIVSFKLPRIPITVEIAPEIVEIDVKGMLMSLFPDSAFMALSEGSFLLVVFLFACLIGWASASDSTLFRPVYNLTDSLSQLFYNIMSFFTEIMSVFSIAIMANWLVTSRETLASGIFTPMIVMFIIDFAILVGIIYPIIIRYVCRDKHPYRVLFASIAPFMLAFISGDSNLALSLNLRHGKESLGIKRRVNGFSQPLFSIFARGGSALVSVVAFFLIWRSYSSLPIKMGDIMLVFTVAFGFSFLLGGFPTGGAYILLTILCAKYGRGFETSFVLIKPATVILCSFAALFDTATAMFGSYIVGMKTNMVERHSVLNFI
ncbi:MAG: cation:dicarboxylase symporter family transporter [Treponema sp.]|nr:cation:dicarboxylase symporter family transporter [Treponema sp.]